MSDTTQTETTYTDEELAKILEDSIATMQVAGRELARRKGTPLTKVCELCKGKKVIPDILAGMRAKQGKDPLPDEECFACRGTGEKVEFWPRFITGANWDNLDRIMYDGSSTVGQFVSIRPCAEEYGNKTYLGLYLGDMATTVSLGYDKTNGQIIPNFYRHNPAIYVFDLKKIIFGMESWWGEIESEEQLRNITNEDIGNVWYVQALRQLSQVDETGASGSETVHEGNPESESDSEGHSGADGEVH